MCVRVDYSKSNSQKKNYILGIDVGKKGAYALIDVDTGEIIKKDIFRLYNHKRLFRAVEFYKFLSLYHKDIVLVGLEKINAFPKDSRRSAFTFGMQLGGVIAILDLFTLPFVEISPLKWKYHLFGKQYKKEWINNKDYSIKYIKHLYPNVSLLRSKRCKSPDNNLADAICIALTTRDIYYPQYKEK